MTDFSYFSELFQTEHSVDTINMLKLEYQHTIGLTVLLYRPYVKLTSVKVGYCPYRDYKGVYNRIAVLQ